MPDLFCCIDMFQKKILCSPKPPCVLVGSTMIWSSICNWSVISRTLVQTDVMVSNWFNVAVDNFCKLASKLMLAVAWDSLGSKSAAVVCALTLFRLLSLSFKIQFELRPNGCRETCSGVNWSGSSSSRLTVWLTDTSLLAEASQKTASARTDVTRC